MDEGLSKAVLEVFVDLHDAGLIYKDKRLVNWDPKFQTAISDLEVEQKEVKGSLVALPLSAEGRRLRRRPIPTTYIVVATTRPETMLGDTAVAVHPEDERYQHLIGKMAVLPLVGREIPIVGDDYSDPEKGTGAVKITPAHDFNDFEVGKRHELAADQHPRRRSAQLNDERAGSLSRPRPLRGAQAGRRRHRGAGPAREDRAAHPHGAARRPLAACRSSRG